MKTLLIRTQNKANLTVKQNRQNYRTDPTEHQSGPENRISGSHWDEMIELVSFERFSSGTKNSKQTKNQAWM